MAEWQLFEPGTIPEWTTAEWYADRESAPHIDQPDHRGRLDLACDFAVDAVIFHGAKSIVDLGCGDGGLLTLIAQTLIDIPMHGYDLSPVNVTDARETRGLRNVSYLDVVNEPKGVVWADLAIATEMLEHLLDPHEFVRRIAQHSKFLVASSPYVETKESHYGYHTWAWDKDGYVALLKQAGFTVLRHETWSMFQVALAVKE